MALALNSESRHNESLCWIGYTFVQVSCRLWRKQNTQDLEEIGLPSFMIGYILAGVSLTLGGVRLATQSL